jgi:transcriptional regulator with XRE-family HTH domain
MATQEGWRAEAGLTRFIAERVRRQRKALGMSARDLSDSCDAVGYAIPRSTIADLENGRRQSISVHELLVLARALAVSPIDLIYPLEVDGQVDAQGLLDARDWWRGHNSDSQVIRVAMAKIAEEVAAPLLKRIEEQNQALRDLETALKVERTTTDQLARAGDITSQLIGALASMAATNATKGTGGEPHQDREG